MQLSTAWTAAWTINAMRIVQSRVGWIEHAWEGSEQLRLSACLAAVGIVAFAACEIIGRIQGWRRRRRIRPTP